MDEVQNFAMEINIQFSTDPTPQKSKSKCIFMIGNRKNLVKPPELKLCETKTFLLQNFLSSDMTSARTDILGRYPKYFLSLRKSACYEVRVLAYLTSRT